MSKTNCCWLVGNDKFLGRHHQHGTFVSEDVGDPGSSFSFNEQRNGSSPGIFASEYQKLWGWGPLGYVVAITAIQTKQNMSVDVVDVGYNFPRPLEVARFRRCVDFWGFYCPITQPSGTLGRLAREFWQTRSGSFLLLQPQSIITSYRP